MKTIDPACLEVVAATQTDGISIIEAVERSDKRFALGVQFHPEAAVRKALVQAENAGLFLDYDTRLSLFQALVAAGKANV